MTLRPRQLVMVCGLVPTLVAALVCVYRPALLAKLEYSTYDTLMRAAHIHPRGNGVAIVDIDEHSLAAVGQWPWRRDVIGDLILRLRDLGASAIALDMVFAESDRHEGPDGGADQALADALRPGRVVLGYALTFDSAAGARDACVQHPVGVVIIRQGDQHPDDPFFRASGAVCSLPALTRAAGASGFLNAAPDADGLLRRVPLLLELGGRVYPSLALAATAAALGTRDVELHITNVNASSLALDARRVPLDGKSNLLLRYRGPKQSFPYVSAARVLSGQGRAEDFKGKVVFIGTTALGTREVVSTPLDTLFTGVEVQATVADNLLQQDFIRRHEHAAALEIEAVLGLGLVAILAVGRLGAAWGSLAVAACIAASWGTAILFLSTNGVVLSPLFPTMGVAGAFAAMTLASFIVERRRADRAGHDRVTSQRLMVQTLLSLTEVRDAETGRHSRRTQEYARVLAEELARHPDFTSYLTAERIELLSSLAPLHDIGKVAVPDRLLHKPGALTAEEIVEMRKHPVLGRDVILHAEQRVGVHDDVILALTKDIVYTHHERWDGSGYPQGLRGKEIPIAGRLMAIVDVYDAVRTQRLYHQPMSHERAVEFILTGRGTHFDPAVVDAFVSVSSTLKRLSEDGVDPVVETGVFR